MSPSLRALGGRIGAFRNPSSLGAKLVLILTAVGLIGSAAITLLLASVIVPSFNQLESRSVDAHVERTRAALGEYASKVESAVRDYGDWNASYDYMAHQTVAFEEESFAPRHGESRRQRHGLCRQRRPRPDRPLARRGQENPAMRAALLAQICGIDFHKVLATRNSASFFVRLGPVVSAVGVAQVRRSDGSGTPRGYVLMARRITSGQLSGLLQLTAGLDLANVTDTNLITPSRETMRIAVPILGPGGHAVASAAFTVPREVSVLGRRMLILAVAGSTILLLVVLLMLRRMIGRLVLRPLHRVGESYAGRPRVRHAWPAA